MRSTNRITPAPPIIPPICGFVSPLLVDELSLEVEAFVFAIAVGVGVILGTAEAFEVFAATDGEAGVDAVTNVDVMVCICESLVVVRVSTRVKVVTAVE